MAGVGTSTRQNTTSVNEISLSSIFLNGENDDQATSGTFVDLEALHCPICCDALTSHIFQCDNGHLACSTCCNKLWNKCPSCSLPIGHIRCRAMERIIKAVIVQCPNAKLGCEKKFSYGKESIHEKECTFSLCSCPEENCNYMGSYKNLYSHFENHNENKLRTYEFCFGDRFLEAYVELTENKAVVLKEREDDSPLFVIQYFTELHGVYVTVSCISPSAVEVGEFSCHISICPLSTVVEKYNMALELPRIKRIRKLNYETPQEDFMLIPNYLLGGQQVLKLRVCIKKLNQE